MSIFDAFARLESSRAPEPAGPVEYLIVGLGNPGAKYENTRHNAGFQAMARLEKKLSVRCQRLKFKALSVQAMVGEHKVLLMKPQTFMNLSGEAVRAAAAFYQLPPEKIVVMCDDISLAPGALRIRSKGSAGGQNGLKSIILQLNSDQFVRVRIGVGAKPHPEYDLADWVLSGFTASEKECMEDAFDRAAQAALCVVKEGVQQAMQRFNGGPKKEEQS